MIPYSTSAGRCSARFREGPAEPGGVWFEDITGLACMVAARRVLELETTDLSIVQPIPPLLCPKLCPKLCRAEGGCDQGLPRRMVVAVAALEHRTTKFGTKRETMCGTKFRERIG